MVLQTLRKGASGYIAKAFLFLLTMSFVIWGIADVFRGFGANTVASVGSTEISANDFRTRYLDQLRQIGQRTGRGLTSEQARMMGLDRQILAQMIAESALDEQAKRQGLAMSDGQIVQMLHDNPAFRPPGAQAFDPTYFLDLLRANGLTEQRFLAAERQRLLREQVVQPLAQGITTPTILRTAIHRYETETRTASFIVITPAVAGAVPAPTDEQLKAFYDAHKITFRAPEFRKVSVLALTPDALAAQVNVTPEEVKAAYERERSKFGTPERRAVQQIVFPSQAEAAAALEKIKAGTAFSAIAKERGLDQKDVNLGLVTKAAILDPKVADAAFALPVDGTSAPLDGRFGAVLVHVSAIEPENIKPLSDVEPQLRHELAVDKARRLLLDKHDAVEDERASGSTLAEVAKKLGFPLTTLAAVDRSGRDPDGKEVDIPGRADVVAGAFASAPGVETDTIQLPQSGGFVWYETDSVTPSRERTFDEVKSLVTSRWTEEEAAKLVDQKAKDLLAQAQGGAQLSALAEALGIQVLTAPDLRRGIASASLPGPTVAKVFDVEPGGYGLGAGATPPAQVLFRVDSATVPPETTADARMDAQIAQQLENDLLMQYLGQLQKTVGVTINERALQQSIGGGAVN